MESWIEFGRGPAFRLSFVLMILGLMRIFLTAFVTGMKRSMVLDETGIENDMLHGYSVQFGIASNPAWRKPLEVLLESIYHLAVILVPLFVAAHVIQWHKGVGFAWFQLPQQFADQLTVLVIVLTPLLAVIRFNRDIRGRRMQASLKPLFVAVPFITGYICVNGMVSPTGYHTSMVIHVWAGNLLMLAIGFSDLADMAVTPVAEFCSNVGARFGKFMDPIWKAAIGGEQE